MSQFLAKSLVRDVPDFPKPGIIFKDLCPVIADPPAYQEIVDALVEWITERAPDAVIGIESRGFIFGAPAALASGVKFVLARKPGKLPGEVVSYDYVLEYGTASIELQSHAIMPGDRVVVIDDVLATGGTSAATVTLVERLGGQMVGIAFVVELEFLNGRELLAGHDVKSLIRY